MLVICTDTANQTPNSKIRIDAEKDNVLPPCLTEGSYGNLDRQVDDV